MTRKEDIEKIKGIFHDGVEAELTRRRNETERMELEAKRVRDEESRQKNLVELRLRNTGVVDLFEGLRDEGVVERSKGEKAVVDIYSDKNFDGVYYSIATLRFNFGWGSDLYESVSASWTQGENKLKIIGEKEVFVNDYSLLPITIGKALLKPKHVRDTSESISSML